MDKENILILAVVGMPASGKSEVLKLLEKKYNFFHLYYGDITFDEIKKRGMEITQDNEKLVREELRSGGDLSVYSKLLLPKIENAIETGYKNILLESMYNIYEYEYIKDFYGDRLKVLAIHADRDVRMERIKNRKERSLNEDELQKREIAEAKNLQKGSVIAYADFHYINNGSDMDKFKTDIEDLLDKKILKR